MLDYNRIAYELDGMIAVPDDVEGLSMLMHFDYPEAWHLHGNAQFSTGSKFGTRCVYFPDAESSISIANTTSMYNLNPLGNYEFEAFVKLAGVVDGNIFSVGGLALKVTDSDTLQLVSTDWGIDATTTTSLDANTWYHLLLRISGETIKLFIDGTEALSEAITGNTLRPETVTLGGFVGWMDEFVFRRNAGSTAPTVPTHAYGAEVITETVSGGVSNAPVSRVAWICENLPAGLELSSAGVLSGHPTTAGTYECEFSVATNWGTATKTVRIVVA